MIKFIDSVRLMASSLSNLVDNLAEEIHKIKCKDCDYVFEYESVHDNLVNYKFLSSNKIYSKQIKEDLKNRFKNTFKFSNDIKKINLLTRKSVYLYEFMDDWEKYNEKSLPQFCSNLDMEIITDSEFILRKKNYRRF